MGNTWTKEQQQVIDLRDCNMLVSAAAGSGKTAVLVERIISRIMEKEKPVDIDRLLVVTFTNAAAAEMRERILAALEEKLEQHPDNIHLQRQVTLVHRAQITTIHSFCLDVIRNYFHTISLDPGFRIGDEGELKLLRHDVMEQLLEEAYAKGEPEFLKFSESFAPGKSDQGLEDVILQFYDFSMGYPWPEKWRQECEQAYLVEDEKEFCDSWWMKYLLKKLELQIEDMKSRIRNALEITREPDGPWMYGEALEKDLERLEALEPCKDYGAYSRAFRNGGSFAALSRKKDPAVSEEKKDQVKEIREQVKKQWKKLEEDYFFAQPRQMMEDMVCNHEVVQVLIRLADQFQEQYRQKKAEKNMVDFHDLEHFALDILLQEEEGNLLPSPVALEYAGNFQEIMIDEYQDSNLVQELLLTSVSRQSQGGQNVFMVGDVKQSIYRFRLARPELFMEKYRSYTKEEGPNRRIDLHKNFRSRSQVLEGVNLIFRQIMINDVGGVEYDADAALYPGAEFAPGSREEFLSPELLLVLPQEESQEKTEEEIELSLQQQEAQAVGFRIREMVGKEQVWDKEDKCYRPARYSDIVILLRAVSGWTENFVQILGEMGVPVYAGASTGYFSTLEIKTMLAYLQVLDNPRQDIPLAAVLRSPIGKLTDEELAQLRINSPETDFYTCCENYLQCGESLRTGFREPKIYEKLSRFWKMTGELREILPYTPMHLLLWKILEDTGYGDYAAAMPGGAQRKANLEMLVEKAVAYEATSYRGLFNFIRYIEHLQKYEIDYGEASAGGEAEDTVRIMSIHKSKGLEFPIVLVCGMGKSFNQQDARSRLVLHPELGIGCDYTDLELRVKMPVLMKKVIGRQIQEENLGEELRVLYVAMTRAREKLILVGAVKRLEEKIQKWYREAKNPGVQLSYSCIISAGSYLDWVMPALLRHRSGRELLHQYRLPDLETSPVYEEAGAYEIRLVTEAEQQKRKSEGERWLQQRKETLSSLDIDQIYDPEIKESLETIFQKEYPYKQNREIPGKMTVSELKKMGGTEPDPDAVMLIEEPEIVSLLPRFKKGEEEKTGAARGTIYHTFLENFDFTGNFDRKFIETQLETLVKCGKILEDDAGWVSRNKILRFLDSHLGKRMQQAAREAQLCREQPFVLGVPANYIRKSWDEKEEVLIQGIIDAYFYEKEEIVLVDYKTDFIPEGKDGSLLVKRYGLQLDCYQMALERLTGKKVKEKWIYSFYLNQAIAVERK